MAFKYLNVNPLSLEEEDCVCRAIKLASGKSYAEIEDKLYYVSRLLDCEELCVCCYQFLLNEVFMYEPIDCLDMSVGELAELYKDDILIIRINGHLTCSLYGDIYDLWDCRDLPCDVAWRVNNR